MFLRHFPASLLSLVYERIYLGDGGLLVNLYMPAAEAALGRALAGKTVRNLLTDASDRALIRLKMNNLSEPAAKRILQQAANRVGVELGMTGALEREYLVQTAEALLPRLLALEAEPGYRGIFASREAR